jgi:hypothetical protein
MHGATKKPAQWRGPWPSIVIPAHPRLSGGCTTLGRGSPTTVRVIKIIDSVSITIIDVDFGDEGSTGGLFSFPSGVLMTASARCPHREIADRYHRRSRECRGQADRIARSQLDAGASSWLRPIRQAEYRDWKRWQKYRPIATFTENKRSRRDVDSCNGQLPYRCTPDRVEGWNRSKLSACSILISVRTVSNRRLARSLLAHRT